MSSKLARIALDAMGGDHAPRETVRGAVAAARADEELTLVLVGDEERIRAEIREASQGEPVPESQLEVVHASQVVGSGDSPVEALRTLPDSSIKVAAQLLRAKEVDGLVAAGNTGAVVACGTLLVKLLPGVRRPGIAAEMPTATGGRTVLCDVGANIHCKPLHLFHYGIMAARYAQRVNDCERPKVGLLNVGSEEGKGTGLVKETAQLFAKLADSDHAGSFDYIGNIEGNEVFSGRCDVVVCEGFVGNVVLKTGEGLYEALATRLSRAAEKGAADVGLSKSVRQGMDWADRGGAPLLGVDGLILISHGRSSSRAISNALAQAALLHRRGVLNKMIEDIRASA